MSFIDPEAKIGKNTVIWFFSNIYGQAQIGESCQIGSYVTIQGKGTKIGDGTRIGDYSFIPAWTVIEENVFLGQMINIINDKHPKAFNKEWKADPVIIRKNSSIGSGAVLMAGIEIGENSNVGAGAVVIESVPPNSTYVGNPARPIKREKL